MSTATKPRRKTRPDLAAVVAKVAEGEKLCRELARQEVVASDKHREAEAETARVGRTYEADKDSLLATMREQGATIRIIDNHLVIDVAALEHVESPLVVSLDEADGFNPDRD